MASRCPSRSLGFTLGELVLTIVVMGILAAIAVPRFMSSKGFESRGFYDEAQAVVRFAQKTAIARRQPIVVCVAAGEVGAISNSDCNSPVWVPHPVSGAPLRTAAAPAGVTLSPVTFSFDGMGRPSAAQTISVTSTIAGDPVRQILVAAETGYVHR
jgi:MSHA pilin protein MshC